MKNEWRRASIRWVWWVLPCGWLACGASCSENAETVEGAADQANGGTANAVAAGQATGGIPDRDSNCSWGGSTSDPSPVPLSCDTASQAISVNVQPQGSAILVLASWCGMLCRGGKCATSGTVSDAAITAIDGWATVTKDDSSRCASVLLEPAVGVTEGDVDFTASIAGLDQCQVPLTCPLVIRYHLSVGNDGNVTIARI
jgi:hypothetical protein